MGRPKNTQENAAGGVLSAITEEMVMDNDIFWDTVANIWVCLKMGYPNAGNFFLGQN